jgi:hypothetical protein
MHNCVFIIRPPHAFDAGWQPDKMSPIAWLPVGLYFCPERLLAVYTFGYSVQTISCLIWSLLHTVIWSKAKFTRSGRRAVSHGNKCLLLMWVRMVCSAFINSLHLMASDTVLQKINNRYYRNCEERVQFEKLAYVFQNCTRNHTITY